MVNDTKAIINLANKYTPVNYKITYADLLAKVQTLVDTKPEFVNNLSAFLLKKGYLKDYNNAGGVIGSVASVFTSVVNATSSNKDRQLEQQKLAAQNTTNLMNFMAQEEKLRQSKTQTEATIIYIAIGAMVLITGIIILKK